MSESTRHAAITPSPLEGELITWCWSWTLHSPRGYPIACQPAGDRSADPVACAQHLTNVLQGTLSPDGDEIALIVGVVRLLYDTLCPFGRAMICAQGEVCEGCVDRATVAAIESVSEES